MPKESYYRRLILARRKCREPECPVCIAYWNSMCDAWRPAFEVEAFDKVAAERDALLPRAPRSFGMDMGLQRNASPFNKAIRAVLFPLGRDDSRWVTFALWGLAYPSHVPQADV